MTFSLKHTFQSAKADGTDSTLVQPSAWNAEHTITLAAGKVLGRDTSAAGAVQELPLSFDTSGNASMSATGFFLPAVGTTAQRPGTPSAGMVRFNSSNSKVETYNGTAWVNLGNATVASTAPTSPATGDFWYDTANSALKVYDGTTWQTAGGGSSSTPIRQQFTATAGQTSFAVTGGYTVGQLDVYLNGSKLLVGTDVTASTSPNVVLATAAAAGDVLEVVGYNTFSVANALPLTGGTLSGALNGTSVSMSGNIASTGGTVADSAGVIRPLLSGTSVATTSGTAIDISTAIPSWVKRITLAFLGVSLSGSSNTVVQIGSSTYTTTGYSSTSVYAASANQAGAQSATNGLCVYGGSATNAFTGTLTLVNMGGNVWVSSHNGLLNSTVGITGGGSLSLGAVLDRIRIASANGTDTFDAGSVNILYE